ncbi:MAG: YebC/PmpR family DNA-binding transcriptional regulator [Clostridiales bacterium]|nr:YebC/PmpR family DNA-binding transcriptional regulator [Clostridiales bacterium]
MSGHSKWANIKRKKEKTDAVRGKSFTKIGREIAVAVKEGGPDPNNNARLRDVIAKAKANNMPNDNIMRGIKKASGELGSINYEDIQYEGYGTGGIAVIVKALTDNRNRTASDVRHIFDKFGGNLGTTGCVSYMFDNKGIITLENNGIDEDEISMLVLDLGAEDIDYDEEIITIYTDPTEVTVVSEGLTAAGYTLADASVGFVPQNTMSLDDEAMVKFEKMLDMLEENDDVQDVWHNLG